MKKVAMVLIGNIRYDGRVQKEIKTLLKNKIEVVLYVSEFDKDDRKENYNFKIEIVNINLNKRKYLGFVYLILFNYKVMKKIEKLNPDYVHCNDLNTLFFCKRLSKKYKVIFDAHELFPESGSNKLKIKIWNLIEKINVKYVYKIIQAEQNRLKYFKKKHDISNEKIELIENYPLKLDNLKNNYFIEKYGYKSNKKNLLYIGVIMGKRGISELLKAIKSVDALNFFIIGKFSNDNYKIEIEKYIKKNKLENRVFLKPSIPQNEVLEATNSADISFIFYRNINLNNYYCASNKLYECLNCGLKILTNDYPGILSVTKNMTNVYNLKKLNTKELKAGLEYLLSIKKTKKTEFYWENQEEKFINIYK